MVVDQFGGASVREPGLMGFIAKIGSPGVSPHQSWLKPIHSLQPVSIDRENVETSGTPVLR